MPEADVDTIKQRLEETETQAKRLANTLRLVFYLVGVAVLFRIDGMTALRRNEIMHDIFRLLCAAYGVGGFHAADLLVEKIKHSRKWG